MREYIDLYKEGLIDSIALCDIDESRLEPFKEQVTTYTDTGEFIRDIDAVHICTNNQTHYEIAKVALANETNVLVEKPMTMNHDQAYNLVEMAILPHLLDIINFITGEWPSEFGVTGRAYRREKLSEVAFIQADFNKDFFASIAISWLQPIRRRTMEIVGSKRSAIVDCVGQEIEVYEADGSKGMIDVVSNNTIRDEAFNFLNAIKTGKNTFNSAIVGARCVEMIERVIAQQRG